MTISQKDANIKNEESFARRMGWVLRENREGHTYPRLGGGQGAELVQKGFLEEVAWELHLEE